MRIRWEEMDLAGRKFVEWEDMGDEVDRALIPVFLEERAALGQSIGQDSGVIPEPQGSGDLPAYRVKGWPIGSGLSKPGVKLFGRRVQGIEQFWNVERAEAILVLRSKWLSDDE